MCTLTPTHIHPCAHIYKHTWICTHVQQHRHQCAHRTTCAHPHIHPCTFPHIHVHAHRCTHTLPHIHQCAHMSSAYRHTHAHAYKHTDVRLPMPFRVPHLTQCFPWSCHRIPSPVLPALCRNCSLRLCFLLVMKLSSG